MRENPVLDEAGRVVGVVDVSFDVSELKDVNRALLQTTAELGASVDELKATQIGIVEALGSVTEVRDPYTAGHQRRVSELACVMAERMGLTADQVETLRVAALVHDIGKLAVPLEILTYPGPLGATERLLAERHAAAGYEILKGVRFPGPVAEMVREHHERLDGSGYPQRLTGDDIMLEAPDLGGRGHGGGHDLTPALPAGVRH